MSYNFCNFIKIQSYLFKIKLLSFLCYIFHLPKGKREKKKKNSSLSLIRLLSSNFLECKHVHAYSLVKKEKKEEASTLLLPLVFIFRFHGFFTCTSFLPGDPNWKLLLSFFFSLFINPCSSLSTSLSLPRHLHFSLSNFSNPFANGFFRF